MQVWQEPKSLLFQVARPVRLTHLIFYLVSEFVHLIRANIGYRNTNMELERRINSSIKYVRATYVLVSQIFRAYSTILLVMLIRMQSKNLE